MIIEKNKTNMTTQSENFPGINSVAEKLGGKCKYQTALSNVD